MLPEINKNHKISNFGFTLIEMMVVIGIIVTITGLFLVNFNALEGPRNLNIAQNQLTTDIRKIQSYTLSSRNVSNSGQPASYYVIKFDMANPTSYTLGAIDKKNDYFDLQVVKLPKSIQISDLTIKEAGGKGGPVVCAETAFSLPFGRVYMDYKEKEGKSFAEEGKAIMGEELKDSKGGSGCDIFYVLLNSGDLTANKNIVLTVSLIDTTHPQSAPKVIDLNGISQVIDSH